MDSLSQLFYTVKNQISTINFVDIIDLIVVSLFFYFVYKFIIRSGSWKLLVGVGLVLAMLFISNGVGMHTTNFILENIVSVGIIALLIVFQPELRALLSKVGNESIKTLRVRRGKTDQSRQSVQNLCEGVRQLSETKTGALIIIEQSDVTPQDLLESGTVLDAEITPSLMGNIFYNKAPLHDGAVIVRNSRIYAAGCFISDVAVDPDILKDLGSRHRAGIGLSKQCDAIVVIVSEETGIISVAEGGKLVRNYTSESLEKYLAPVVVTKPAQDIKEKIFGTEDSKNEK